MLFFTSLCFASNSAKEIADDPEESFHVICQLTDYESFLLEGKHKLINGFSIEARQIELRDISRFAYDKIPGDGYISSGTTAARELGIFALLKTANAKSKKNVPGVLTKKGFLPEYAAVVLCAKKMFPYFQYAIVRKIEDGAMDEAVSLLSDWCNLSLLTFTSRKEFLFVRFIIQKYALTHEKFFMFEQRLRNNYDELTEKTRDSLSRHKM